MTSRGRQPRINREKRNKKSPNMKFQKNFIENKKKTKKLEQENKGKLPGTFRESQGK